MIIDEKSYFMKDTEEPSVDSKTLKGIYDQFKTKGWAPVYAKPGKDNSTIKTLEIGEIYSISPDLPKDKMLDFFGQYAAIPTIGVKNKEPVIIYPAQVHTSEEIEVKDGFLESGDDIQIIIMSLKNSYMSIDKLTRVINVNKRRERLPWNQLWNQLIFKYDVFNRILPGLNDISKLLKNI